MKKSIKYIYALFVVLGLGSCLKDDELIGPEADGAIENIIEFRNIAEPSSPVTSTYPLYIRSLELEPTVELRVPVQVVGVFNPTQDITVNVEIDNSLITSYNQQNTATYTPLQTANYTVPSYQVTIPKGQKSADFVINLLGSQFDFNASYALGLKISSVSNGTISGNFGSIVVATIPKNPYDGIYSMEAGTVQRYSTPTTPTTGDALNGSMAGNPDVTLSSIDANTVQIANLRWAGGTSGIAGIDNLRVRVDPVTNQATVFALGNTTARNIVGAINKYDPATKTFTLNFDWNQTANKREVKGLVIKYSTVRP